MTVTRRLLRDHLSTLASRDARWRRRHFGTPNMASRRRSWQKHLGMTLVVLRDDIGAFGAFGCGSAIAGIMPPLQ